MNRRVLVAGIGFAVIVGVMTASVAAFAEQGPTQKAGTSVGVFSKTKPDSTPGTEHYSVSGIRLRPADAVAMRSATVSRDDAIVAADGPDRSLLVADASVDLKYYSNDVAGDIQADGSVELVYQNVLAWVVTSKLVDPPVLHGLAGREPSSFKAPANLQCYEKAFVSATTGKWLNSMTSCQDPKVPVPQ